MGGFARHPGPHFLTIGALTRSERVQCREQQQRERSCLNERDDAESVHERRVADVYSADTRLPDRRVLSIE